MIANNAISTHDTVELKNAMSSQFLENESFKNDIHLNELVNKPWGHEYRIFCNQIYDAWKLKILARQETSMHCHPRKDTVLLCLEGSGTISYLDGRYTSLVPGKYVHIPKGLYHSTTSGNSDLHLIELENPRNKLDLLRLSDRYGRKNTSYEKVSNKARLEELKNIGVGTNTLIRGMDYEKKFQYSLLSKAKILKKIERKISKILFIATIDDLQHLQSNELKNRIHVYTIGEFINSSYEIDSNVLVICKT